MELTVTSFIPQLFGIIIAIIGALYMYIKHVTYNYWKSQGIVQPECITPLGQLLPVFTSKKSIGELIADVYSQYKQHPVVGMYSVITPSLVICDPELVRFVMTKKFWHFQDRGLYSNEKMDPLSGHLFLASGTKWKNLRSKFTPTFSPGKIKQMFVTIKECSENLAECVAIEIKQNELVEVRDLLARFTCDVITSVAFGIDCNSLRNPNAEFRSWSRKIFTAKPIMNTLMILYPPLLRFFNISTTDKGVSNFFINAFKETVEYRLANNVDRKDFLDLLMQLIDKGYLDGDEGAQNVKNVDISEDANGRITMLDGAAQAFIFWIAGFETSSTTATYTLYELALNQDIQDTLAEEVNRVLAEFGGLTYDSINGMPYLHKVLSETMRKYPPVPFLNRQCNQDTDLPDSKITVKKGTAIVIPVLGLHTDPDIYPNPDKYDPERFTEEKIAGRHSYAYLPFGEGPRNCIGARFGLIQTKIAIITIISKYSVHPVPDMEVPLPIDKGNFIHGPLGGVTLRLEERK